MALYTQQRFIFMALDPVHIRTGQTQIGRVDNTIIRETGNNMPKIPGTSLMGAARSYASLVYGKPEAAGQHKKLKIEDRKNCPIIYTFGTYTNGDAAERGQQGKISISDAQILFFPVYSIAGPVWVTTSEILKSINFAADIPSDSPDDIIYTSLDWSKNTLNLGWLHLPVKTGLIVKPVNELSSKNEWKTIEKRVVIASSRIFSQIVNSNLEVRTSVAINPETGTAEDGALFTYEAIPRATWFWSDVVQDNYTDNFPKTTRQFGNKGKNSGDSLPNDTKWDNSLGVVISGFELMEFLGVGGMTTRGFGRMKKLADWELKVNEP